VRLQSIDLRIVSAILEALDKLLSLLLFRGRKRWAEAASTP